MARDYLKRGGLVLASVALCAGCGPLAARSSGDAAALEFAVLENRPAGGFTAELALTNRGPAALGATGWALYFNFGRAVDSGSILGGVDIEHLNGDLYRLRPTPAFEPLPPGGRRAIRFDGRTWLLKESDAPAGPYLVLDSAAGSARALAIDDYTLGAWPAWPAGGVDVPAPAPTPEQRYRAEAAAAALEQEAPAVVPTPVAVRRGDGQVVVDASWRIAAGADLGNEGRLLATALGAVLGAELESAGGTAGGGGVITLRTGVVEVAGAASGGEAYRLVVDPARGVEIVGAGPAGVFYGTQSLLSLVPVEAFLDGAGEIALPAVEIEDAPRFAYRGLHLDVARNFQSRPTLEKLLEVMAFYKLNRFHLHLSDDEGWRLAIAGLPELTEVGGRRGHTVTEGEHLVPSFGSGPEPDAAGNHGSGHYTRQDFVAVLRHAAARHVEVVPEIDVPGHARAAIRAMAARAARLSAAGREEEARAFLLSDPQDESRYRSVQGWSDNVVDVCLPSTYRFLEAVVADLVAMYEEAGAPLTAIHVGGDEVPGGVWERSPACRRLIRDDGRVGSVEDLPAYFLDRLSEKIRRRGLVTAGWEEIALREEGPSAAKRPNPAFLDRRLRPYVWNNVWGWGGEDLGYRLANAGYEVVLANATNLYFDLAYDRDPREPGYAWAGTVDTRKVFEFTPLDIFKSARQDRFGHPIAAAQYADRVRLSAEGRRRVLGIQGQIWGENAKGREAMEYLAFPKAIALAERAWAAQPAWAREEDAAARERQREAAWRRFAVRLGRRELPRLDAMAGGVAYRLPPPGAVIEDGLLLASVRFPGLEIRFTTDGSEPGAGSPVYRGPVPVSGPVRLRSFDRRGRGSRTTLVQP